MSRNAPPKITAAHIRTTFLSIVFEVCLRSVEQNNPIRAKYERRKLSREKSGVTDNLQLVC